MKIISQFKDYFDYLVYQYGIDEKLILDRRGIGNYVTEHNNSAVGSYGGMNIRHKDISNDDMPRSGRYYKCAFLTNNHEEETHYWLVVNGRGYPMVLSGEYPFPKLELADDTNTYETKRVWNRYPKTASGTALDVFKSLSIACKRHAFITTVDRHNGVWKINGTVPILGESSLPKLIDPQTMYLQTVDFISENFVDKGEEIAVQSDIQKVLSHGFDKKTSFRGK